MPSCQKNIPKVGDVSQLWSTHPVLSPRLGHRPHPVHRRVPKRSKVSRKKLQKIIFTYLIGEIINHLFNLTLSRLLHGGFFFCAFFFSRPAFFPIYFSSPFLSASLRQSRIQVHLKAFVYRKTIPYVTVSLSPLSLFLAHSVLSRASLAISNRS